jgi:4-carboxymuconolactone decarboxylase
VSRLEKLLPSVLTREQTALYEQIVEGPRKTANPSNMIVDENGGLEGPFNAMLLSPALGAALQGLGSAVRFSSSLQPRARELAILMVAHHSASDFEWKAHEALGRSVGLSLDEIDAIRCGRSPVLHDELESAVVSTVESLVTENDLDDARFMESTKVLGVAGVFEITTLVGYYQTLALQMRVFRT